MLDELGLTFYDKKALVTLGSLGVADAGALCREGGIPTSKIYLAMEKLGDMKLVEVQETRPRLFTALPAETVAARLVELARERAEKFAKHEQHLRNVLAQLPGKVRGRKANVDLALGPEGYVKRHLVRLACAREGISSYIESGDLNAIDECAKEGFHVLRRLSRNSATRSVPHRVVFGFSHRTAPRLMEFLKRHAPQLSHLTGVRYSGELGHPFHIIDRQDVILSLDHPFVPGGTVASLLIQDKELAQSLAKGFDTLWDKAMRDLREIRFHPQ